MYTNRVSQFTCFSNEILDNLRNEYNKVYHDYPISGHIQGIALWKALRNRFEKAQLCTEKSSEKCFVKAFNDPILRKKINRYVFAPSRPLSWRKNKNDWLTNFNILHVLEQYEEAFPHFECLGPSTIDFDKIVDGRCISEEICKLSLKEMKSKGKTDIGIVFNLATYDQEGSHWVAMYIDIPGKLIFYFDSVGEKAPPEIDVFVKRLQTPGFIYNHNSGIDHQRGSSECGMYTLFFIVVMLTGKSPASLEDHIIPKAERWKRFISKEHRITDSHMEDHRHIMFSE